jgi:hypothetical protein
MMCSYAETSCYEIARRPCTLQKYAVISYEIDITFCLELGDISKLKPTLLISATEFTYLNMSASGRPPVWAAFLNEIWNIYKQGWACRLQSLIWGAHVRFQTHMPVNRNLSAFCEVRPYSLVERNQQPGIRYCYYWRGREVFLDTEDCNSSSSQTTVSTCKYTRPHIPEENKIRVKIEFSLFIPRRHTGGVEVCLHSFWALTVDGGLSLTSRPDSCTPETENRYLLNRRKGGPHSRSDSNPRPSRPEHSVHRPTE